MTAKIDPLDETEAGDDPSTPGKASVPELDGTLAPETAGTERQELGGLNGLAKIGRYVCLARLGEGGMGVVIAAYDPKLDRKVAIKLIHILRRDDGERRRRMEREAQAMARLSHPNVVTVYEVGEYRGQLFLAMEFVKGRDLRGWLAQREGPADWRATLAVFIQAGHGLAAAHRVGLVHRDFKPDNVFLGDDGRVRVGDFGLARQGADADADTVAARAQAHAPEDGPALAHDLTRTGAMMGTPAYMAPEQFEGKQTDARTDQFSFCAALWEALYGERPFAGTTMAELIVNVTGGKRAPTPVGKHVPAWVRKVLDRGLAIEPSARYPSTDAMLAALQADPTRRRRLLAGAGVIAFSLAAWFGVQDYREARQVDICVADGASISDVWNADVARELQQGLIATGVSYAATTAEKVVPYFNEHASVWQEARTAACLDYKVHGRWDEDMLDQGVWCLEERKMELEALIAELTSADKKSVQKAIVAAATLAPVEPCRDVHRLSRLPPLPHDREDVQKIQRTLSQAGAQRASGDYKKALVSAQEALASATALGWSPLTATARWRTGELFALSGQLSDAEASLEEAFFSGTKVGALEIAAEASIGLIAIVGHRQARPVEGVRWSRQAEVLLSILGIDDTSLQHAGLLNNLAMVHNGTGAYEQSKALLERALAIRTKVLGPHHPVVAQSLHNLANAYDSEGAYGEAKVLLERSLVILTEAMGADHPHVANSLNTLANVEESLGDREAAKALHRRALAIWERALGPEHPNVADSLNNLAVVHKNMGEYGEAKALYGRALAIRRKVLGPEHPLVAGVLNNLAQVSRSTGEFEEAKGLYGEALAIMEKALGADHPNVASPVSGLARLALIQHRPGDAVPLAERAVRIRAGGKAPPETLAESHFTLAQALWEAPAGQGRDRDRALMLAREARDVFRDKEAKATQLAEVEAFLAQHDSREP